MKKYKKIESYALMIPSLIFIVLYIACFYIYPITYIFKYLKTVMNLNTYLSGAISFLLVTILFLIIVIGVMFLLNYIVEKEYERKKYDKIRK